MHGRRYERARPGEPVHIDAKKPGRTPDGDGDGHGNPALGQPGGGLTSKIHLACAGRDRPLTLVVTGGNTNDCTQLTAVMEQIRVPRIGPARPRVRPDRVLDDKGYSEGDPLPAPPPRHPAHDSRAGRPGPQPDPTGQPRRPRPA